jgi:hypothetical protein
MLGLLIIVAVLALAWGLLWQRQPRFAFAIFIGLPLGWLFYRLVEGHFTGSMDDVPLWLPPLPMSLVAIILIVYGAVIWFRADQINSPPKEEGDE